MTLNIAATEKVVVLLLFALCRGNNFSGPLDLRKCTQLQMADVQGNRFTGSLPVDGRNRALSVLRADHNSFNGTIPLGLWDLPSLMSLELTNNRCACGQRQKRQRGVAFHKLLPHYTIDSCDHVGEYLRPPYRPIMLCPAT